MLGLGLLSCAALVAVIGYHMVRPNYRDIRVSMAHLMPDPPESRAPKRQFSLRNLIASPRFWLRLLCVGLVALALFPLSFAVRGTGDGQDRHFRIALDVSGSMGVVSDGASRMELGVAAARAALTEMQSDDAACVDMIIAGRSLRAVESGKIEAELSRIEPAEHGQSVDGLFRALGQDGPCGDAPSHAVVVSDLPAQLVPEPHYAGHVIWHQIGVPADNLAIWDVAVTVGALQNRTPEMILQVAAFGAPATDVTVRVDGPGGRTEVVLRRDETRAGGWVGSVPYAGAGRYRLALAEGGALELDDAVTVELGALEQVAVDWRLTDIARPRALAAPTGATSAIVVAPYTGSDMAMPEGPFVLTYPGWPNDAPSRIGPFMSDHATLRGVNFDVLEANAPRAVDVGEGFRAIIRPDGDSGVWLAERDGPRGVVVPHPAPQAPPDVRALAKLMFFNALSFVAQGGAPTSPSMDYVTQTGATVPDARAESDTARPLADPPGLGLLRESPRASSEPGADQRREIEDWMPWLFMLALLVMLAERAIGLVWLPRRRGDV